MAKRATESSGNVFADLGLSDAEELNVKAELAIQIGQVMRLRGLNQTAAAHLTGISQPDLSRLLRGHLREFTSDRLMDALRHLNVEMDIQSRYAGEPLGRVIHLEPIPA